MKITMSVFLILFLLIACSDKSSNPSTDCDINSGPCIKSYGGREMSFGIEPRPVRAMGALYFSVKLKNYENPRSIIVDLSMHGMAMGSNQVLLKKTDKNAYEGHGIVPVCPTGKKLWKAGIIIDDKLEETFSFNVQY
jgi:hypothetical protein